MLRQAVNECLELRFKTCIDVPSTGWRRAGARLRMTSPADVDVWPSCDVISGSLLMQ